MIVSSSVFGSERGDTGLSAGGARNGKQIILVQITLT